MCLEDREDHVLLALARETFQSELFTECDKIGCWPVLELTQVHAVFARFELLGRNYLDVAVILRILRLLRPAAPTAVRVALVLVA